MRATHHAAVAAIALCGVVLAGCLSGSTGTALRPTLPVASVPILDSWQSGLSGRYARVVETTGGEPVSTWPAAHLTDTSGRSPLPAYADVQRVRHSDQFVYVDASGLASHQMGPWYWNVNTLFGNWPRSQGFTYKLPKHPIELPDGERRSAGLGPQGAWVNGVAFFNQLDGAYFDTDRQAEVQGGAAMGPQFGAESGRLWVRDAIPVEGPTFDASNAHQPPLGAYHYHSNPLALRMQLDDNVSWDTARGMYVEDTSRLHHSPILGWARDGYPIYGPYAYAQCSGATSVVRRMRSGFVLRDGSQGTTDLRTSGRKSIGRWAAQLHGLTTSADARGRVAIAPGAYGPDVSSYFYLGRYNEDHEYLGDQGKVQGGDFDLDRHNGRFCATPEFPLGTYAYHVTLTAQGRAVYPYTVGRQFRGDPKGEVLRGPVEEPVIDHRWSIASAPVAIKVVQDTPSQRVLSWASAEGATYVVESSTNGQTWDVLAPSLSAVRSSGGQLPGGPGYYASAALTTTFTDSRPLVATPRYRVSVSGAAAHSEGFVPPTKGAITAIVPASVTRGTPIQLAITLWGAQPITDNDPLASIVPFAVELVSMDGRQVIATGSKVSRQLTQITADFMVPPTAPAGEVMVRVRFRGLPPPALALQSQYQSVGQLAGVPPQAASPGLAYADLTVTVH